MKSLSAVSFCLLLGACSGEKIPYQEASREERQGIHLLRLVGTPYEMGYQHGRLMARELIEGVEFLQRDPMFSLFLPLARSQGLTDDSREYSYPDIREECRGMADGAATAGVDGWTEEACLALAYGDVIIAFLSEMLDGGCTQFAAAGPATRDGRMVHGRNMDWDRLSYLINHPTVIVRRPKGGIPFVSVGFPGNVAPYNGLNAEGLALASNNNGANPQLDPNRRGRPGHTQMIYEILARSRSIDEAEAFLRSQQHSRATIFLLSDGPRKKAAVFEISPSHLAVRVPGADGLVYATNHFVEPRMDPYDNEPDSPQDSTVCRLERLKQLLEPGGEHSLYGKLDAEKAISVLRDRKNGCTGEVYPPEEFDTDGSIANNGAIWSMLFLPEEKTLYLAAGEPPVPSRRYLAFGLEELLYPGQGLPQPEYFP